MTHIVDDDAVVHLALRHEGLVHSDPARPYVPMCDSLCDLHALGTRPLSLDEFKNGIKPLRQFDNAAVTDARLTCFQCLALVR